MASIAATLVETEDAGSLVLAAAGEWLVETAAELVSKLKTEAGVI